MSMKRYQHTQKGPLHLILMGVGVIVVAFGVRLFLMGESLVGSAVTFVGILMFIVSLVFRTLTTEDGGSELRVRFGPIPLIKTSISYRDISAFQAGRSDFLDGFGIHAFPGRGWIWNVWGFDCVELEIRGRGRFRVGTDDPEGLIGLLEERVSR